MKHLTEFNNFFFYDLRRNKNDYTNLVRKTGIRVEGRGIWEAGPLGTFLSLALEGLSLDLISTTDTNSSSIFRDGAGSLFKDGALLEGCFILLWNKNKVKVSINFPRFWLEYLIFSRLFSSVLVTSSNTKGSWLGFNHRWKI